MTNSVTFPIALGGDGSTVTDDSNALTGLDNGGHRARFVPALGQTLAVAQFIANLATNVYSAPGTNATSTTSLTVGIGAQNLTIQAGKSLFPGQTVVIAYATTPSTQMIGVIVSYNSGTGALVVNVTGVSGAGTQASWIVSLTGATGTVQTPRLAPVGATGLTQANNGYIVDASGTWVLSFSALSNGFMCFVQNIGAGIITVAASDGLANWPMYNGEARLFYYDGVTLRSVVLKPFYRKTTVLLNYIHPPGYSALGYDLVGGGGGGGAGRRGAAATLRLGGAPGGAPSRVRGVALGLAAGTALTITVGAAGPGAPGQTVDSTDGATGTAGGNTAIGTLAIAYGGAAGLGGNAGSGACTSGSGSMSAGTSARTGAQGGLPSSSGGFGGTSAPPDNISAGGGGTRNAGNDGGCSEWGGAASAGSSTSSINKGGSSVYGVPAGGIGGLVTAANAVVNGGEAGTTNSYTPGGGAVGGTSGAAPTAGGNGVVAATDNDVGTAAAGGGSSATTAAMLGGNGAAPGGPGGGGGASPNGFVSGGGGNGTTGRAIIWGVV